ncbi:MAG: RHS repeat-associated core domain-containing protein, partial [Blastocatellia bacterium]
GYGYDGDGQRISKQVTDPRGNTTTTIFVYNAMGQLIADYGGPTPTTTGTSYLTTDHLGSTRVITDSTTPTPIVLERDDYLPFGEEIGNIGSGRNGVVGYSSSTDVRQKFTSKEQDTESGLDYFGSRYFSGPQGRFTGADGLLSSGTIYDPQSWNRYTYALNDPLKYTDPFGLYVFDSGATDAEKRSFRQGLATLRRARDRYRGGSAEYSRINRALTAYGREGVDNGVTVKFGATRDGTPAETVPGIAADASGHKVTSADNPTGQRTTVTVDPTQNTDSFKWATSIGHEGSHVADIAAFAATLPSNLADPRASAALTGPFNLNLAKWTTEWKAYTTESNIAQALAHDNILSVGGDTKFEIWNGGWAAADVEKKRASGIFTVLTQPQSQHGVYHLNPFVGDFGKRLLN